MRIRTRVAAVAVVAGDAARRLEPVHLGHADVHQHHVGALAPHELDAPRAPSAASPTTSMSSAERSSTAKPLRTSAWSSATATADHVGVPVREAARATRKPPPARGPGLERAAVDADALAHADQAVAAVGRPAVDAAAVVGDLERAARSGS